MPRPTWTEQLSAWSTFATAALTLVLVVAALITAFYARRALDASREANLQAKRDSIEQTRPYIYAEIIPSLGGESLWDIRIANAGRSSARQLTLDYSDWPSEVDDVGASIRTLFRTARTLPPQCSIRAYWRLEGNFTDGTTEAGLGKSGVITARYTSDDPSRPQYVDAFDVMIDNSGLWPTGESGPNPDGLKDEARKFYLLGQTLVRRVAELGR